MSRDLDHLRQPGSIHAWQALNARVAEDLAMKRGDIRPAVTKFAYYDSEQLHTVSAWITQGLRLVTKVA